jgi:hypothetical protein
MFFKKKEDKKALPDLPVAPSLPLPKFPTAPLKPVANDGEEFSQSSTIPELKKASPGSIKVDVEDEPELPEAPEIKKFKAVEMEEWSPDNEEPEKPVRIGKINKIPEMDDIPVVREPPRKIGNDRSSDIFVKLDKFRNARRALEEIKIRSEEIESLLKKIRETKLREEQELAGWEKEINNVKARVQDISSNIFEKVE